MIWWQRSNQPRWQHNLWVPIQITMIWSFPHLSAQLVTLLSPLSVSTYCKSFIGHNSQCISQLTVCIGGQKRHFCGRNHWFNRIPTDFLGLDIWLNWIITINQFSLNRNWIELLLNKIQPSIELSNSISVLVGWPTRWFLLFIWISKLIISQPRSQQCNVLSLYSSDRQRQSPFI